MITVSKRGLHLEFKTGTTKWLVVVMPLLGKHTRPWTDNRFHLVTVQCARHFTRGCVWTFGLLLSEVRVWRFEDFQRATLGEGAK